MKRFASISAIALTGAAIALAGPADVNKASVVSSKANTGITSKVTAEQVLASRKLSKNVTLKTVRTADGMTVKKLSTVAGNNRVSAPAKTAPAKADGQNTSISEGFEGYDSSNPDWLPAGWSIKRNTAPEILAAEEPPTPWGVSESNFIMTAPEGNYMASINFSSYELDEWLVLPEVQIENGYVLSYTGYIEAVFLFGMDNVDWETMEYIGDPVQVVDVKVVASTDGGNTWTTVKSYAEDNMERSFNDMLNESGQWSDAQIDLSQFAGQSVILAFQYVGTDGNTVAIDNVKVGKQPLKVGAYYTPFSMQFFGLTEDWSTFSDLSIGILPVFSPLTWMQPDETIDGAKYTWSYMGPDNEEGVSNDEMLTLTYHTDYTSDFTTRNNLYTNPVLTAELNDNSGSYTHPSNYFQAGGRPEFVFSDSETGLPAQFGMMPFSYNIEGMTLTISDDLDNIPVFGYDKNVDHYWSLYTFQDDEAIDENNYAHLTHILNAYMTSDAPLVINGARVLAKGKVADDADFTLDVVALNDDGTLSDKILGSATIKGSEIQHTENGVYDLLQLPFEFAEPVSVSSADCMMYVVRLTGFNDPRNEYFAPYNSLEDSSIGMCHGYLQKELCFEGEKRTDAMSVLVSYTGHMNAFAFILDAVYPWLETETAEVSFADKEEAVVALNSYYDGTEIKVADAPAWLNARVEGRYGSAKLILSGTATGNEDAVITLQAPGVSKQVKVKYASSGIQGVTDAQAGQIVEYMDLQGRRTDAKLPGIYLGRRADGSIVKIIK